MKLLMANPVEDPSQALRDLVTCTNEERQCFTVADLGDYWVDIVPMIYNHRVVLTPKDHPDGYTVGWCYPSMTAALLAVNVWDPGVSDEPVGYIKRVGDPVSLRTEIGT